MKRSTMAAVSAPAIRALAVVALLASAGCSGSKAADRGPAQAVGQKGAAGPTSTTARTKPAEAKPQASAKAKADTTSTTTTTGAVGSRAAETSDTTQDPLRMTLPVSAEVTTSCVRPGGTQTITIKAPHGSGIGYDVMYADGLTGLMEGHYGGNFAGYADEEGTFVHTFPVAATAPAGPAVANVLGTHMHHGFGEAHARFAVADALGRCETAPAG